MKMRRNIYFKKPIDVLLVQYAQKYSLKFSELLTQGLLLLIQTREKDKKFQKRLSKIKKVEELSIIEESLRFDLKKIFFSKNIRKLFIKSVDACHTKKDLLELLNTFQDMAKIMEHKEALKEIKVIRRDIKDKKKFDVLKDDAHKVVKAFRFQKEKTVGVHKR